MFVNVPMHYSVNNRLKAENLGYNRAVWFEAGVMQVLSFAQLQNVKLPSSWFRVLSLERNADDRVLAV